MGPLGPTSRRHLDHRSPCLSAALSLRHMHVCPPKATLQRPAVPGLCSTSSRPPLLAPEFSQKPAPGFLGGNQGPPRVQTHEVEPITVRRTEHSLAPRRVLLAQGISSQPGLCLLVAECAASVSCRRGKRKPVTSLPLASYRVTSNTAKNYPLHPTAPPPHGRETPTLSIAQLTRSRGGSKAKATCPDDTRFEWPASAAGGNGPR